MPKSLIKCWYTSSNIIYSSIVHLTEQFNGVATPLILCFVAMSSLLLMTFSLYLCDNLSIQDPDLPLFFCGLWQFVNLPCFQWHWQYKHYWSIILKNALSSVGWFLEIKLGLLVWRGILGKWSALDTSSEQKMYDPNMSSELPVHVLMSVTIRLKVARFLRVKMFIFFSLHYF